MTEKGPQYVVLPLVKNPDEITYGISTLMSLITLLEDANKYTFTCLLDKHVCTNAI